MAKIQRNSACPCGSGRKFKRCHGSIALPVKALPPHGISDAQLAEAAGSHRALEFQRQRQQGRGRPIISTELKGIRFVAVGERVAYGKWKTFPEFLLHHAKHCLGLEWGQNESLKPDGEKHPFVAWLEVLNDLMLKHTKNPDGLNTMPSYGAARAAFGLAYDLYLIEHHLKNGRDRRAFERLLNRIRHPDQFFGARHEARAAGMLLRAGFDLAWEDEHLGKAGGYGEFVATFPQTGRSFWVECKMRQPGRVTSQVRFTHLVSDALQKTTDLERLIFVELNLKDGRIDSEDGGWPRWAVTQLRLLEGQPTSVELPPALIFLSNYPEHRHLDALVEGSGMMLEGFKTAQYRLGDEVELLDAIEERESNVEMESLWRSVQEHSSIPTTFDGSIPGLRDSERLLIGHTYELDDGEVGVLEDATVVEQWRKAAGILRKADGKRVIYYFELSEDELEAWRQHPETFFGAFRHHTPEAKTPLDLYEFFADSYSSTAKDKLLEFMSRHSDIEQLRELDQPEILKRYAYRMATTVAQVSPGAPPPLWLRRLRPHKR